MLTPKVQPKFSAQRLEALQRRQNGRPVISVHFGQRAICGHEYVKNPELSRRKNIQAYTAHQIEQTRLRNPMQPQGVFPIVKFLAGLDQYMPKGFSGFPMAEFHIASENGYDAGERLHYSLEHFGIPVKSSHFTSGDSPLGRVNVRGGEVFFSGTSFSYSAIEGRVPALRVLPVPADANAVYDQIAMIWDWDATVVRQISEAIFQTQGLDAFRTNEILLRNIVMEKGPVAAFFLSMLTIRALFEDEDKQDSPLINGILTARDDESAQRIRSTFFEWGNEQPLPLTLDDVSAVEGRHKGRYMRAMVEDAMETNGRRVLPFLLDDSAPNAEKAAEAGFPAAVVPTSARG